MFSYVFDSLHLQSRIRHNQVWCAIFQWLIVCFTSNGCAQSCRGTPSVSKKGHKTAAIPRSWEGFNCWQLKVEYVQHEYKIKSRHDAISIFYTVYKKKHRRQTVHSSFCRCIHRWLAFRFHLHEMMSNQTAEAKAKGHLRLRRSQNRAAMISTISTYRHYTKLL